MQRVEGSGRNKEAERSEIIGLDTFCEARKPQGDYASLHNKEHTAHQDHQEGPGEMGTSTAEKCSHGFPLQAMAGRGLTGAAKHLQPKMKK